MALPFINGRGKKSDQILAVDLGGRTTKAVHLQRRGEGYALLRFAVLDAPIYEKTLSADLLSEHLKAVVQAMDSKVKNIALAIGVNDSVIRHAEMPTIPIGDMRQILKNNTKTYLQQDLPNHLFDCYVIPPRASTKPGDKSKATGTAAKQRVLVAGAKRQLVDDLHLAMRNTGLTPEGIAPGLIGPVNAFEHAMPEVFRKELIALVDIGYRSTTICIVQEGELMLTRVLAMGGDRITSGLAESLGISYAEAEGIKLGMPQEVQSNLETLITPLGRELRASIDFFEHQQDQTVGQVFISGASSRSELITKMLEGELMLPCKTWNPTSPLQIALAPQQIADMEHIAPELAVAVGTATAYF